VGVESAAGTVACRFALETPSEPSTFTVPEVFAARLTKFFERHIASHDPEDPRSPEHPEQSPPDLQGPRMRYNCHLFALAMLGVHPVTPEGVERLLVELARSYKPFEGNLPVGVHGVLRHANVGFLGDKLVTHSFIGMGTDVPLALQVVNNNSNVALMPYDVVQRTFIPHPGVYELAA